MKKIFMMLLLLSLGISIVYAVNTAVFVSTFTNTSIAGVELQNNGNSAHSFRGVMVSSATAGSVTISMYDSRTSTAVSGLIGMIDLSSQNAYLYDIHLSSGLYIKSSGAHQGATIIYK